MPCHPHEGHTCPLLSGASPQPAELRACLPGRLRVLQPLIAEGLTNPQNYVSELLLWCGCDNRLRLIIRLQECLAQQENKESAP